MSKNSLRFYAFQQRLIGSIGKEIFDFFAVSGGARGSTQADRQEHSLASFSPYRASKFEKEKDEGQRGGSIPPGIWKVLPPKEYKGNMTGKYICPLIPSAEILQKYSKRFSDGKPFLIHGTGKFGSDGCIVVEGHNRELLAKEIEKVGAAILTVIYEWDENLSKQSDTA